MMKNCKNNSNFFWCNLKNNLRLDGRNFEDSRNISIYFLGDYGNVEVSIGHTKVICRITSEIVKPFDKRPNEGIIKINLDIDSFTNINNLRISDDCLEIKNLIERILKSSNLLNFESLCIIPHKKVWCLLINIVVIENDGNLYDSCYLSAYSALMHFRNNDIKSEHTGNIIFEEDETNYSPLSIHNSPILTTFAYFNCEDICLIDPTIHEEEFMSSKLSVALNKNGKLISILKPGGSPISYVKILEAIELAKKRVKCILKILEDALEEDKNLRNNLKKRNLHIKYSYNPVPIKYDSDNNYDKPLDIPLNRLLKNNLNIERIIKKYEQYIKLHDMEKEEKLIGNNLASDKNEVTDFNRPYNKQHLLSEQLRKIKNEYRMKNEDCFRNMGAYDDNHINNPYMNESSNFPVKNENICHTEVVKTKRQECSAVNSYSYNMKLAEVRNNEVKERINFSSSLSQSICKRERDEIAEVNDNKDNKKENGKSNEKSNEKSIENQCFRGRQNLHDSRENVKEQKSNEPSALINDDSSDIDFSVAISENLKTRKKKKKN
ncbi:exosome complex component RRP45, putative [Plasmodium malariae]|uniref:Exosome complex component RRP45, putative n=1 Tax=Plasmodium malariae TaxID=5858 RepID=A0A1C3KZ23_PLAMA|nr:exosome complex component RRP45, putative [Plasmodium malariae]